MSLACENCKDQLKSMDQAFDKMASLYARTEAQLVQACRDRDDALYRLAEAERKLKNPMTVGSGFIASCGCHGYTDGRGNAQRHNCPTHSKEISQS